MFLVNFLTRSVSDNVFLFLLACIVYVACARKISVSGFLQCFLAIFLFLAMLSCTISVSCNVLCFSYRVTSSGSYSIRFFRLCFCFMLLFFVLLFCRVRGGGGGVRRRDGGVREGRETGAGSGNVR